MSFGCSRSISAAVAATSSASTSAVLMVTPVRCLTDSAMASHLAIRRLASVISLKISGRSEEHTSELQSLMRNSYAVFCLKKKKIKNKQTHNISSAIILETNQSDQIRQHTNNTST